jgi:hypothetical protein
LQEKKAPTTLEETISETQQKVLLLRLFEARESHHITSSLLILFSKSHINFHCCYILLPSTLRNDSSLSLCQQHFDFPAHHLRNLYRQPVNGHLAMTVSFASEHDFVEIHDSVALTCKWAQGHVYLGTLTGGLIQLSPSTHGRTRFHASNAIASLHCLAINDIAVSSDGRTIITTSLDGTCFVTNANNDELEVSHEIECPDAMSPHCAVARTGTTIAVVGAHGSLYINDGSQTFSGKLSDDFFKEVAFYGDDDTRIVCLARHNLSLVDVENRTTLSKLAGSTPTTPGKLKKSVTCVATHPRHGFVAVGTLAGWIELYDIEREEKIRDLKIGGELIEKLEFSPDGQTLAIAQSNRAVSLFDVRKMEVVDRFEKQRSRVLSISFCPEGDRIVAISEDKTVVIARLEIKQRP